ncbi:hypothetical protein ACLOJK_036087 [Asimina triloba]
MTKNIFVKEKGDVELPACQTNVTPTNKSNQDKDDDGEDDEVGEEQMTAKGKLWNFLITVAFSIEQDTNALNPE